MIQQSDKHQLIAAIDIGTNSIHMVIAYVDSKGALITIRREKQSVRLGESMDEMKILSEEAMERGIHTLKKFVKIAGSENAVVRATASSAVREAENKHEFLERARTEAGTDVEVIAGEVEARLIYKGVIRSLPLYDQKVLVVDIGGGSTETIIGKSGEAIYLHSEKLGAIRLSGRFFEGGICTPELADQAREFINERWNGVIRRIKEIGFSTLVGTSGTIQSIASIALALDGVKAPDILNGISIPAKDYLWAINRIVSEKSVKKRDKIPGMDKSRTDILPAGSLIIEYLMNNLDVSKILISSYALREGIVFDTLERIRK